MTSTWKSGDKKSSNNTTNNTVSGTTLSSWSRQQKIAMATIAGFAILGLLLALSACSKQSSEAGSGRRVQHPVNSGNARGHGDACSRSNRWRVTYARKEDAEETLRERHL